MTDMTDMTLSQDEPVKKPTREASTGNHGKSVISVMGSVLVHCINCVHWGGVCAEGGNVVNPAILRTCGVFEPASHKTEGAGF
jgi:hypothetical protein